MGENVHPTQESSIKRFQNLPETNPTELKVVTFNIYMDGYKDSASFPRTIQAIADANADIVCLQECSKGWRSLLEDPTYHLTAQYQFSYFYTNTYSYGGRAILSKYPITATQWLDRVYRFWYGALWAKIQLPSGMEVSLLNIHLRAPFPGLPWRVQQERLYELEQFWSQLHDLQRRNMIIMGDMNTARGLPHAFLQDQGLVNALQKAGRAWWAKTWNIQGTFGFLFDHIYYDPASFTLNDAEVLQHAGGSDHWPLMATFQLPA